MLPSGVRSGARLSQGQTGHRRRNAGFDREIRPGKVARLSTIGADAPHENLLTRHTLMEQSLQEMELVQGSNFNILHLCGRDRK
ncbi:conserved hypothetical protein [Rhizobium rhizogenes K84]|uniref:Uncharacterized protein n=1 Tax=Rhizobium rhizogenes (strain K84 / ATCC BAA-868) TaxID=311403 RepID=B9JIQ2_RHIR8|nr:conserved hypothetical protein [Rhizobium rhizogenes K84]